MSTVQLEQPTEAQVARMLDIFIPAFAPEPGFQYMFQDPRRRLRQIRWVAERKFALVRPKATVFVTQGGLRGFSWWIPPTQTPFASLAQQLKVGYAWSPLRCGVRAFRRMLRFSAQERALIERFTTSPVWVLDTIAVDPAAARQGLGGALLEPGLREAERSGHDCFVLTHNARNVRFYEKHGFSLRLTEPLEGTRINAYCLVYANSPAASGGP